MMISIKYYILFVVVFSILQHNLINGCPVYITTSLDDNQFIQINWGPGCNMNNNGPELIALYSQDPSIGKAVHNTLINTNSSSSGIFTTKQRFDSKINKFPGGWAKWNYANLPVVRYPKGKCLDFYTGAMYKNEPSTNNDYDMSVSCLKIQPNWMTSTDHVSEVPLKNLFIPGTHSSGAYSSPLKAKSLLVKNFGYAQDYNIWSQLVFGIRFLDLKIGYRENLSEGSKFWIVNENMFINPLKPILNDIKEFVRLSEEVVIVDFSDFPLGFSNEPKRHIEFLEHIRNELESFAYERSLAQPGINNSYDLTIDEIRAKGKNLIILYPVEELTSDHFNDYDFIWPSWKKFTIGNLNSDEALDFMRLLFSKKDASPIQNEGWIFHGVKALETSYDPNHRLPTTKERAKTVNLKINMWLAGPWSLAANVVTVDFFMNTNLIDLAIQVNTHKGFITVNKNLTKIEM